MRSAEWAFDWGINEDNRCIYSFKYQGKNLTKSKKTLIFATSYNITNQSMNQTKKEPHNETDLAYEKVMS